MKILSLTAREILDSRANPTVEVELKTEKGVFVAGAPSGASTGEHEACELRDGGVRRGGLGVLNAVKNVEDIIAPKILEQDVDSQGQADRIMLDLDGTENKSRLGANAIVAVSMAISRALAAENGVPLYRYLNTVFNQKRKQVLSLPRPCFNVINGGAHAGNDLDVQEFMLVPQAGSFAENLEIGAEVYRNLKMALKEKIGPAATNVGDEGGFAPSLRYPEQALDFISDAVQKSGMREKVKFILDVAASQFFKEDMYKTQMDTFTREGLANYYLDLISKYPIIGLEDPFAEDDFEGWQMIKSKVGERGLKVTIVGDDLTVTNPKRIVLAQERKACDGMIIKVNQIGTVSEAMEAVDLAKEFGWKVMISHRSGETCDDFIADLAVGVGADLIKSGAPARGERGAKYNRLAKIEKEL